MDLSRVIAAARRWWWILAIALVVGVVGGIALTKLETPQYTATTRLFVSTTGGTSSTESYSGEQFSQQRTASYAEMVTSEQVTQRVVDELGLSISAQELSGDITATVVPRTVLMDVSARSSSPIRAADIANTLAAKLVEFIGPLETPVGQEEPRSTIAVVKAAEAPTAASSPQMSTNVFYGVIGGLIVGVVGILLLSLLAQRVHTADQLRAITRATVMGPVRCRNRKPEERRDQLFKGDDDADADDIRRLRVQIEAKDPAPQVLLLAPVVEGTSALNLGIDLAVSFADAGRRTALVCTDPSFASANDVLGLENARGMAELLSGRIEIDGILRRSPRSNLAIVPPGRSAEIGPLLSSPAMNGFVDELRKRFDRIVVVTASVMGSSGASVLSAIVDADLLVVDMKSARRGGVQTAVSELKSARAHLLGVVAVRT